MTMEALPGADAPAGTSVTPTNVRHPDTSSATSPSPSPARNVDPVLSSNIPKGTPPATFVQSGIRLHPQDGRIRDPVPSKLKGVSRDLRGNFAVMHMDVNSHPKSKARGAAAQRTSEGTALQAKLASTPAYVSHHRRANYPKPGASRNYATSTPLPSSHVQISPSPIWALAPTPDTASQKLGSDEGMVMLPLTPQEVKSEQARLLTLLRTLPPSTVVDQFCKALAFFGGIPEAPPPADGRFPGSGEANGPGSLFVGWVSEIFPNLEKPRRSVPRALATPVAHSVVNPVAKPIVDPVENIIENPVENHVAEHVTPPVKRPRGRPKGSKASKVRSDKGIKKGPLKSARKLGIGLSSSSGNGGAASDKPVESTAAASDVMGSQTQSHSSVNTIPRSMASEVAGTTTQAGEESIPMPSRKRGRPKGSKNRPKESLSAVLPAQAQQVADTTTIQDQYQKPAAPEGENVTENHYRGVASAESSTTSQNHSINVPNSSIRITHLEDTSLGQSESSNALTHSASQTVASKPTTHGTNDGNQSSAKRKRPVAQDAFLNTSIPNGRVQATGSQGQPLTASSSLSQNNIDSRVPMTASNASVAPKAKKARRSKVNPWMKDLVGDTQATGDYGRIPAEQTGTNPMAPVDSQILDATTAITHRAQHDCQHLSHDPKQLDNVAHHPRRSSIDHNPHSEASHSVLSVQSATVAIQQPEPAARQNNVARNTAQESSSRIETQQPSQRQQDAMTRTHDGGKTSTDFPVVQAGHHISAGQQRQRDVHNHSPVDAVPKLRANNPHRFGTNAHRNQQSLHSHNMEYSGQPSPPHGSSSQRPHNNQLTSSMETTLYRPNVADTPSTHGHHALQNLPHSFGEFPGSHMFDLQSLEHNDGHNGMGLDGAAYDLQLSNGASLRRAERSSVNPSYSTASGIDSFITQADLAPNSHQNRWHG